MKEKVIEKFCSMMKEHNQDQVFVLENCMNAGVRKNIWYIRIFFPNLPYLYIPLKYKIFSCIPYRDGLLVYFELEYKHEI